MITGSLVAIITPMREDSSLDLARFKKENSWETTTEKFLAALERLGR